MVAGTKPRVLTPAMKPTPVARGTMAMATQLPVRVMQTAAPLPTNVGTITPIPGTFFPGTGGGGAFGSAGDCGDFEGPTVELPNVGVPYHYTLDGVTYSVEAFLGTAAEVGLTVNMSPGLCFDLKVKDPNLGRTYTYRVAATFDNTVWIWIWEDLLDLVK